MEPMQRHRSFLKNANNERCMAGMCSSNLCKHSVLKFITDPEATSYEAAQLPPTVLMWLARHLITRDDLQSINYGDRGFNLTTDEFCFMKQRFANDKGKFGLQGPTIKWRTRAALYGRYMLGAFYAEFENIVSTRYMQLVTCNYILFNFICKHFYCFTVIMC